MELLVSFPFFSLSCRHSYDVFFGMNGFSTTVNVKEQGISLALALADGYLQDKSGAFRVHGGGFAGTVQAFVPNDMLDTYKNTIEKMVANNSKAKRYSALKNFIMLGDG